MSMHLDHAAIEKYLTRLHGQQVQFDTIRPLDDASVQSVNGEEGTTRSLKTFGYGRPVLVRYHIGEHEHLVVLHTVSANQFGHENRADRAAALLLDFDTFNTLPRHVPAIDIGIFVTDPQTVEAVPQEVSDQHHLLSLKEGGEFFLLSQYVDGRPYADDLQRLRDYGELRPLDLDRTRNLATYLAGIHSVKFPLVHSEGHSERSIMERDTLYRRRIRDTIGSGEGIIGLIDSYPADFGLVPSQWLKAIEQACVDHRWRLRNKTHRLCQVHGDFHPFNILFTPDGEFWLLDRSRGAWGESADDVSCLAINYLFFSLQRSGRLAEPFTELWNVFWNTYLDLTGDEELLSSAAPFLIWRALVLANPVWYNVADRVRCDLLRFIEHIAQEETFDPFEVNTLLGSAVH